jgi:DNA-directed RNA polymerase subunit RPC12/RpoP
MIESACKICGSRRLAVFAHTAVCQDCGVLLGISKNSANL